MVHAWVGQIVTFFAYRPPSRPLGSLTPTQPGRVTNPTQGHPDPPWEAPQAECWLLRREPKPPARTAYARGLGHHDEAVHALKGPFGDGDIMATWRLLIMARV